MTERELDRRARHRLAIIRHAQKVTSPRPVATKGVTRTDYYKWLHRDEAGASRR